MGFRTGTFPCKYCGVVLPMSELVKTGVGPDHDSYACPECASEHTRKGPA